MRFKPYNLDVLPLNIVLMMSFRFVPWSMLRRPGFTMPGSFALYLAARQFGWSLAEWPQGQWFFNRFCWQLLFCLGPGRHWAGRELRPLINSQWLVYLGGAYPVLR